MKLVFAALAAFLASPLAAVHAQVADQATWARFASGNGEFSVELPCSAEQVAAHSPRLALERRVDPSAAVGCRNRGSVFAATLSTLRENEQPGRPFFDILLGAVTGSARTDGPVITESSLAGRRMLVSREIHGGSVAQVQVIELDPRSCLLMIAGGEVNNTMSALVIQEQMRRFFASVEIVS